MFARIDVEDWYRRYGHVLFRRCRALLGRPAEAEDAVQEVFVRVLRYGHRFWPGQKPLPWLFQIANRVCFDRGRLGARSASWEEPPSAPAGEGNDTAQAELRCEVMVHLQRLDPLTQEVAILYHVEGMTLEEIARQVGRTRKTVARRLERFTQVTRQPTREAGGGI